MYFVVQFAAPGLLFPRKLKLETSSAKADQPSERSARPPCIRVVVDSEEGPLVFYYTRLFALRARVCMCRCGNGAGS